MILNNYQGCGICVLMNIRSRLDSQEVSMNVVFTSRVMELRNQFTCGYMLMICCWPIKVWKKLQS